MDYDWDEKKRRSNIEKHGLDFADIVRFDWNGALLLPDDIIDGGRRSREIGFLDARLVFVVYVDRQKTTRIISLRVATKYERALYAGDS